MLYFYWAHYSLFRDDWLITHVLNINFIQPKMFENPSAIKAKKENLLNSKVKTFRDNYSQSLERISLKSSIHSLAKTVYSNKYNKEFTPKKHRAPSASNPERHSSYSALKGLDMRASHIPNMSDINTQLLVQKRKLQQRIAFLKEQIARETRCRNKADTNWRIHKNHKQAHNEIYQQHCRKSAKLNQNISQTRNQCYELKVEVEKMRKKNEQKVSNIQLEDRRVKDLQNKVNVQKNTFMQQQKIRNTVKAELVKQQRVMDSFSIQTKQLQNQRAMVLLEINQSVLKNKL